MQPVKDLLTAAGVNMTGWSLASADGVSPDGTFIVGAASDPNGKGQAWKAYFPLRPAKLVVLPGSPLNFHGAAGGPFVSDASGLITLVNTGQLSLNYTIALPSWLTVSPASSASLAGGASASVVVLPSPSALNAGAGNYSSSIVFNNTTNGSGNTNVVTNLLVNQPPGRFLDSGGMGHVNPPPDERAGMDRPAPPLLLK